jgi:hypothetical protein
VSGLAADVRVEAVEGPVAIAELAGKGMPVLTRLASGARGFRILSKVGASAAPVAVVRLSIDNGHAVTLARDQRVHGVGRGPVAAGALEPGDLLEASFDYPAGYRLRDAVPGGPGGGEPGLRVVAVENAGEALVYTGRVNETGCAFLTSGILCELG